MVNAPAGRQAGAARCFHRAKCFNLAVGVCRGLTKGQLSNQISLFKPSPIVLLCFALSNAKIASRHVKLAISSRGIRYGSKQRQRKSDLIKPSLRRNIKTQ